MIPAPPLVMRSRRLVTVSVLLPLLTLGPACDGTSPDETSEEFVPAEGAAAALADSNLYDSFTRANSTTTLASLEAGGQSWSYSPSTAKWGVISNQAYLATDDGTWNDHYATVTGTANVRVMV